MTPDDFRTHGHALVDWMADYLRDVGTLPVTPSVRPGEIRAALPPLPPEHPEPFERIIADFRELILPGIAHWNHPGWFAYFPANVSPPSILAEMLTATLGAQCMSWQTSPAATELEQVVMTWLRDMLGLPAVFTGVIQDTASTATLVALTCARERARQGGAPVESLTVYASREAHSSVIKGARLAGYGADRLRLVDVDADFAMGADALDASMRADRAAGLTPACVVATVGTTSSTAVDPLPAIGPVAQRHGAWLHVDAAYAGTAAIIPERRGIFDGVDHADSLVMNPHKWMLVNFDCSAYFVRDVELLTQVCGAAPEYLRTPHDAEVVNYRDWGIQLGRRFRALKLWFVLRSYGVEGLRALVRRHIALAAELRAWADAADSWEVMAPSPFGLVCLRHVPPDLAGDERRLEAHNRAVLARANASGEVYMTHTMLHGRFCIRVAIGQLSTGAAEVRRCRDLLEMAAA